MDAVGFDAMETMDVELTRLSRGGAALRLGLGMGLEALARIGGHHELGYPSLEAYALDRCERAARWVQESRRLARKLESLPLMKQALISGQLGWSFALVLAKVATADDEAEWLAQGEILTVREISEKVCARRDGGRVELCGDGESAKIQDEPFRTLTVTVDREDAWIFECARTIVKHQGGLTQDDVVDALLGEGISTLREQLPCDRLAAGLELTNDTAHAAQRAWVAQLERWRSEAERRCEERIRSRRPSESPHSLESLESSMTSFDFDGLDDPVVVDQRLCRLSSELASRDLSIGRLAEAFWKADGWRRLGYATEGQYLRERLRLSMSSIEAKRRLARKTATMPQLGDAIAAREIGYEAARLVAGIATPDTVEAWIARASDRTVVQLREDVDAAEMLGRLSNDGAPLPPSEATLKAVAAFESTVVSGALFANRDVESTMVAAMAEMLPPAQVERGDAQSTTTVTQMFAPTGRNHATRSQGRVTLKLRVREGTHAGYRAIEGLLVRNGIGAPTCLRFLCESLIDSWKHTLGRDVAYGAIYARDRYRCTSPVCARQDVTPHHLVFRSHGGDDVEENLTSLCTWCHLEGVHGGRLTVHGPTSCIKWTLGRVPHTVVHGRRRIRCSSWSK